MIMIIFDDDAEEDDGNDDRMKCPIEDRRSWSSNRGPIRGL